MTANPYGQRNAGGWCQCAECGRTFGGLTGFDAHRRDVTHDPYDWRCATEAELRAEGYEPNARRVWKDISRGAFQPVG